MPPTVCKHQVDAGNVAVITATADQIQGRLKQAVSYTATAVDDVDGTLVPACAPPSGAAADRN